MDGQTRGLVRVHRFGMESLSRNNFPCAGMNAQARLFALSREAGEQGY